MTAGDAGLPLEIVDGCWGCLMATGGAEILILYSQEFPVNFFEHIFCVFSSAVCFITISLWSKIN